MIKKIAFKNKLLLLSWAFLSPFFLSAQQTNIWYFGLNAGMDFNGGPPVPLSNGIINAYEATASVCNNAGSLLFYTDGTVVRDRNHNIMPNGNGLQGGPSATQCLIVPKPGSCGIYYIFHVGDHISNNNSGDLRYTMVDMCLNNGFGDVIVSQKNILLNQPSAEKITAVKHSNGTDIWVITHDRGTAQWRTFLVSAAGVGAPVLSTSGAVHPANGMIGPVKASHNGLKIATSCTFFPILDVLDFNPTTGSISNPVSYANLMTVYGGRVYGLEFSPNDNLLYTTTCTTGNFVVQIDLTTVVATQLSTSNIGPYDYGMIQTGPDGKLYVARNPMQYLDVINAPNVSGLGCSYAVAGFALLAGTNSQAGLPNEVYWVYPQNPPLTVSLGNDTTVCFPYTLTAPPSCGATYLWNTGATTASLTINSPGTFIVTVNATCGTGSDTINIFLGGGQPMVLSPNTSVCFGSSATLTASGYTNFSWSPATGLNSTTASTVTATPTITTTYTVYGSSGCGADTDNVTVTVNPLPAITVATPLPTCRGASVNITAAGGITYSWTPSTNLNSNTGTTVVASPPTTTTYTVFGTDANGCSNSVGVTVTINPSPTITVTGGTQLCIGDSLQLQASGALTYTWGPSTSLSSTTGSSVFASPNSATTYTVVGTSANGCTDSTTVTITISSMVASVFTTVSTPCASEIQFVNQSNNAMSYLWQFGDGNTSGLQNPSHAYDISGNYTVVLIANPGSSCADTSSIQVAYQSTGMSDVYIPNAFTPNGNGLNDVFEIVGPVNCNYTELDVFDRWGELIFQTSDPEHVFWDGRYKGNKVEGGVYVYRLLDINGNNRIGSVTVVR